jgi:hypothetical protein
LEEVSAKTHVSVPRGDWEGWREVISAGVVSALIIGGSRETLSRGGLGEEQKSSCELKGDSMSEMATAGMNRKYAWYLLGG